MQVKMCPATIKAAGTHEGTEEGVFEAIVATYDVDSVGDRIIPGAFAKTLAEWKASGDPIPVVWSHKSDDPDYHIGEVLEAEERPEGLWVKARIDLDDPAAKSAKVYRLLKGRRIRQFSFAYDVLAARPVEKSADGARQELHELKGRRIRPFSFAYDALGARPVEKSADGARQELHELKVYEVGPCMIGANQATQLLGVKHEQGVTVNVHTAAPAAPEAAEPAQEK